MAFIQSLIYFTVHTNKLFRDLCLICIVVALTALPYMLGAQLLVMYAPNPSDGQEYIGLILDASLPREQGVVQAIQFSTLILLPLIIIQNIDFRRFELCSRFYLKIKGKTSAKIATQRLAFELIYLSILIAAVHLLLFLILCGVYQLSFIYLLVDAGSAFLPTLNSMLILYLFIRFLSPVGHTSLISYIYLALVLISLFFVAQQYSTVGPDGLGILAHLPIYTILSASTSNADNITATSGILLFSGLVLLQYIFIKILPVRS